MNLRPWYKVVTPREDLCEGKPLDAAEFAVHLDQVRDGRAPGVYQNPRQFFERTYLTQNLTALASEALRRLSGERTEASAVFNMATQFGGGKTHALTLLYHLAQSGPDANSWPGVNKILSKAGINSVPRAATAVFVGTEFDSLTGRGGHDGRPIRKTPWGEIAYQLGGEEAFALVAEHEKQMIAPAGDVIRRILPQDRPCLILMDELMNYVSRNRKSGLSVQFYDFLHNLSETARGEKTIVLVVSVPASEELEMTVEDKLDYERIKKMLDRLGKAVIMSAESETSEIIRRRLFEWELQAVGSDGKVLLSRDAKQTCSEYAEWIVDHRLQIPSWFPVDHAREAFEATYPFHPVLLSVFERKWQALPRFQQTRGILRLLAIWVSRAYQEGYKRTYGDSLIGLGSAPLDDSMLFRPALLEQLGGDLKQFETAVTTDICGKQDSHAVRLDKEAVDTIKKACLHKKAATAIFFESNGGQMKAEATVPEIRIAVAEPGLDIGNVETVLEALSNTCYFLCVERNKYRFSFLKNLNKILADRRASIQSSKIDERVRNEIQKVFTCGSNIVEQVFFPEKSIQIPDRPALTLIIVAPDQVMQDERKTTDWVDTMTREYGTSARTYKSALIWCIPDGASTIRDEARKALAWEDIRDEEESHRLDEGQRRQLFESHQKAQRDLRECVWRTYKNILFLGKDNTMRPIDLGLVHSSAADTIVTFILNRLRQEDEITEGYSPLKLIANWPPAFTEWSTKSVRDMFYASPQFPRLLKPEIIKDTIARGVSNGLLAYVGKTGMGDYNPFIYNKSLTAHEVEISDDMFIITKEVAETCLSTKKTSSSPDTPTPNYAWPPGPPVPPEPGNLSDFTGVQPRGGNATVTPSPLPRAGAARLAWTGDVQPQKWMNFYTKVLSKFAVGKGLKLTLKVEVAPDEGISEQKIEETKIALRELGLDDNIKIDD
ncbi:MAG: DUF499 domain-containing protein [bacterium]